MKTIIERIVTPPSLPPPQHQRTLASKTKKNITNELLDINFYNRTFQSPASTFANVNNIIDDSDDDMNVGKPNIDDSIVKNNKIRCVVVHPTLPHVAYCREVPKATTVTSTINRPSTPSSKNSNISQVVVKQQIIVQDYSRGTSTNLGGGGDVLFLLDVDDLELMLQYCDGENEQYDNTSSTPVDKNKLNLKQQERKGMPTQSLGDIKRLSFFDPSTLYYSGMLGATMSAKIKTNSGSASSSSSSYSMLQNRCHQRWSSLIVQFVNSNRTIVLNLRQDPRRKSLILENRLELGMSNGKSQFEGTETLQRNLLYANTNFGANSSGNNSNNNNGNNSYKDLLTFNQLNRKPILGQIQPQEKKITSTLTSPKASKGKQKATTTKSTTVSRTYYPTSTVLPIQPTRVIVAYSDNTLCIYDWASNNVINAVDTSPFQSSSNDPILEILSANTYNDCHHDDDAILTNGTNRKPRFITVSKKGIAYLWELAINPSEENTSYTIYPRPVAKFEGHELPTGTISSSSGSVGYTISSSIGGNVSHPVLESTIFGSTGISADIGGSVGISGNTSSGKDEDFKWTEHTTNNILQYDAHRNIFIWMIPSGYTGSSRPHILVWDLKSITPNDQEASSNRGIRKRPADMIPKQDPILIVSIPKDITDTTKNLSVLPGWLNPIFPTDNSFTCVVGTQDGDFYVLGYPLGDNDALMPSTPSSKSSPLPLPRPITPSSLGRSSSIKKMFRNPVYFYETSLKIEEQGQQDHPQTAMFSPTDGHASSFFTGHTNNKVYIHSLTTPSILDPSAVIVNTNLGLLTMKLLHEEECSGGTMIPGALHEHLGADMGNIDGHSILFVERSNVFWAKLDVPQQQQNPLASKQKKRPISGRVAVKEKSLVYVSPPAPHLPVEIQRQPIRLPPKFIRSPSGNFVCLFWQDEQRYEILHLESILKKLRSAKVPFEAAGTTYTVAVSTGVNILAFAWVGDDDTFALLHPPPSKKHMKQQNSNSNLSLDTPKTETSSDGGFEQPNDSSASAQKTFRFDKFRRQSRTSSTTPTTIVTPLTGGTPLTPTSPDLESSFNFDPTGNQLRVELKVLVGVNANAAEISGSIAAATASTLGTISLRGGNRASPTALFGGPVLCVGSSDIDGGGSAHFYTRTSSNDSDNTRNASAFVSSGPSLPYPDFVEWNHDGRLCAVVIERRVAVYLSDQPEFVLLGTALLGSSNELNVIVTSVKFVLGVLYCTTRTTVQCIFLGDIDRLHENGICHMDNFVLACKDVPSLPTRTFSIDKDTYSWSPKPTPMALNHPHVLGYQSGSLLVSTACGVHAIPIEHPLLRVGSLLAAGHQERAQRWFDAIQEQDHEALAAFLDRHGVPELALKLSGLSLETLIDFCFRYENTEKLINLVKMHGIAKIRSIDRSRAFSPYENLTGERRDHSLVVCIGTYLLSHGKVEFVRQMVTNCMKLEDEDGKKDALVLASLLIAIDPASARPLLKAVVSNTDEFSGSTVGPIGTYLRDHML